jgi:hypothetical protein
MEQRILMVVPTHGHFEYARAAVDSFFQHTSVDDYDPLCLVIDDASSDWDDRHWHEITSVSHRIRTVHYETPGGLTRSWNEGLRIARSTQARYCVLANSDVLFTPSWERALVHHLRGGFRLVGPCSNAPGTTSGDLQNVTRYIADYALTDDPAYLAQIACRLCSDYYDAAYTTPINGFFLMAETTSWWRGAFDDYHVFRPRVEYLISGRRNPTPLMTGNEDELQQRWERLGFMSAACPGSFIFHYRAVSRGDDFKRTGWFRKS